jgi:hypothetical protein
MEVPSLFVWPGCPGASWSWGHGIDDFRKAIRILGQGGWRKNYLLPRFE